jgi:glycosyltransferase involved in cell wall biosynthesis
MRFSLIIPCYNESKNLPKLLENCKNILKNNIELILVNNGSFDNSNTVLKELKKKNTKIHIVSIKKNVGYGHGILAGLNVATGDILGWTHADLQTDPEDFIKAINFFRSPKDNVYVKGYRKNRSFSENFFSAGMSILCSVFLKGRYRDINGQPVVFTKSFYKDWRNAPFDFSLDLFSFFYANKKNYKILRFPVYFKLRINGKSSWNFSLRSKLNLILKTILFIFKLRKKNDQNNFAQN